MSKPASASVLEKHDWQSPVLREPYFSTVDAQSSDTPEEAQVASG